MTNVKKMLFGVLALVTALLCLLGAGMAVRTADAAHTDAVNTDFTVSGEGWTMDDFAELGAGGLTLISNTKVSTVDSMTSALVFLHFGNVQGSFTVGFGATDEAAVSLTFSGRRVSATGLETETGRTEAVMEGNGLTTGSILKIETIGDYVWVYLRHAGEPYDTLGTPVATFLFSEGSELTEGSIVLSAGSSSSVTIKRADLYSLAGSVDIETEDYVAPTPEEPEKPEKKGCSGSVSSLTAIAGGVLVSVAGLSVLLIRNKRKKSSKDEEDV